MISDAVRIARINAQSAKSARQDALIQSAMKNPVVELLAAVMFVEILDRSGYLGSIQKSGGWWERLVGTVTEEGEKAAILAAITGAVYIQQLSPQIPAMMSAGSDLTKNVTALLPLLAAGA